MNIRNIFNPFTSLFGINYQKRLANSTELSLFEAKRKYIETAQNLLHYTAELQYQGNRINMLEGMVNQLKGLENESTNSLTTIAVVPTNAEGIGRGVRLPST